MMSYALRIAVTLVVVLQTIYIFNALQFLSYSYAYVIFSTTHRTYILHNTSCYTLTYGLLATGNRQSSIQRVLRLDGRVPLRRGSLLRRPGSTRLTLASVDLLTHL